MSMVDHKRLEVLEQLKGTLQYGQTLDVEKGIGGPDLALASKDLIRWVGDKTDVSAIRVYLGPWQPKPGVTNPSPSSSDWADPTPWAPPAPLNYDAIGQVALTSPVYARVQWGAGGIQHEAFVDWPFGGLVLQVSGSYLQVNAFVNSTNVGASSELLPVLRATMGPEPGGGDSAMPATFTYGFQTPAQPGGVPSSLDTLTFMVPPFARAFNPIVNIQRLLDDGTFTHMEINVKWGGTFMQTWRYTKTELVGDVLLTPFPLSGQGATIVTITMHRTIAGSAAFADGYGCMFHLDL